MVDRHYPAFLVTHGSFNPVHRHHLEMMTHARQELEAAGYTVVRGVLAITPSDRLAKKGAAAVTDEHRLAALRLGCDATAPGLLFPEARGVNYGSGGQLVKGLSPEFLKEEPDATIFKVVGGDTAARYPNELKGPTVVVCREGSTEELRVALKKVGRKPNPLDLFLVNQLPGEECSSTKLREALQLENVCAVQQMCPQSVAEYLLFHRGSLYGRSSGLRSGSSSRTTVGHPTLSSAACSMVMAPSVTKSSTTVASPGAGVTPETLRSLWSQMYAKSDVIGFYGHSDKAGKYKCFSNFFDQSRSPFDFVLPVELFDFALPEADRVVSCEFSEKAIMLCKAAAMGDADRFQQIKATTDPANAKRLGRSVENFDDSVWEHIVCSVAFQVVYQKFSKTPSIRDVLIGTDNQLIAEATRQDRNWGIGIDVGDPRVQSPFKWQGANILGWALMEARAALRSSEIPAEDTGSGASVPKASEAKSKRRRGKKS